MYLASAASQDQAPSALTPVPLDGPPTSLGTAIYAKSSTDLEIGTWWQVTDNGNDRPFSITSRLLSPQDRELASTEPDISLDALVTGDVLVQGHRLSIPKNATLLQEIVAVQVNWADTMESWRIAGSDLDTLVLIPWSQVATGSRSGKAGK